MFKIETIKKGVEVFFSDGSHLSGNFFVLPRSPSRAGGELISELLNGDRTFVPLELAEGQVVLLQKGCVVKVLLEGNEVNRDFPYQKKIEARVCFLSGENMDGRVYLDLPESHSRLSDFLNYSKQFFCLEADDEEYLINSRFVKMVRPSLPES